MLLPKSAILLCCAILCINKQVEAVRVATLTRQWTTNFTYKPEVVQVQDNIYLISVQNYTVNITSIDAANISSLTCKLPVSSARTISTKIVPVSLGNGKILIHGSTTTTKFNNLYNVKPVIQLFIIIDPHDCSTVKIIEQIPSYPRYFETVIPYENSFDLFYSSSHNNTENTTVPKRYDDNGEPIQLDYSLGLEKDIRGIVIQLLKPYYQPGGFFAAFIQDDGLVGLKLLDAHMKVLKESLIENSVDYVSTLYNNITYCYVTPALLRRDNVIRRQQIFCEFLDADLKSRSTVQLYDPEGVYFVDAEVVNLPGGGAIVALAHKYKNKLSEDNEHPVDFYLQRINPNGSTQEAVKIGTYPSYFFYMRGVLHRNGEFCLVIVGESEPPSTLMSNLNFNVQVKCIDTSK